MTYIVYTEIHNRDEGTVERWFYGRYDRATANEVAYELGNNWREGVFHCACPIEDAPSLGVQNM